MSVSGETEDQEFELHLFGIGSAPERAVTQAWDAVGSSRPRQGL